MYSFAQQLNFGAWLKHEPAFIPATITAAAGNDNVAVNGLIIDRFAVGEYIPLGAKLCVGGVTTIGAAETLTGTLVVQHGSAANGSDMAAYIDEYGHGALTAAVIKSGLVTAGTWKMEINIALDGAKRYIRAAMTLDLSRGATDTVGASGMWVLGGFNTIPQPDLSFSISA